jgi:hypothetical protein
MTNKNTIEDELDAIRIKLYEATKEMTLSEKVAYRLNQIKPVCEKYGFKPISIIPQKSFENESDTY